VSLVVTALLVAGGVVVGGWIMRSQGGKKQKEPATTPLEGDGGGAPAAEPPDELAGFVCRLGDVVLRASGGEAWLAGALVFSEDAPVAVLFAAPDAGGDRALLVRPRPSTTILWLDPLPAGALASGAEPPTSVEHDGQRYDRTRRLPLRVKRIGAGAPDVGDRAILAEYARGDGERLVAVMESGSVRAWRGVALEEGMYDVLPGGKATL
jgi:hypothetical protein